MTNLSTLTQNYLKACKHFREVEFTAPEFDEVFRKRNEAQEALDEYYEYHSAVTEPASTQDYSDVPF